MTGNTGDLLPTTPSAGALPPVTRANLRGWMAADCAVLAIAVAFYVAIAVDNIVSWPGNRVLIDVGGTGALFFAVWLLCGPWSVASNVLLYGWPGRRGRNTPDGLLRAAFWGTRERPAWARLPPSMRRPPVWMWLALALAAAGCVVVAIGSAHAGTDKGSLRILSGHRYEVSALGLHYSAWTRVTAAQYQAYRARFMRGSSLSMFVGLIIMANSSYTLWLRRQLLAPKISR